MYSGFNRVVLTWCLSLNSVKLHSGAEVELSEDLIGLDITPSRLLKITPLKITTPLPYLYISQVDWNS